MPDQSSFPTLVDRALRFLERRRETSEAELCRHLFGLPPSIMTGPGAMPWAKLLGQCLGQDPRFASPEPGRWALRESLGSSSGARGRLEDLEFVALAVVADGPKPWRDRVVGVAALHVGSPSASARAGLGRTPGGSLVLGRWLSVTRPERARRLPRYLLDLGLGPAVLEEAPTFAEVADDLREFLGERPLVGVDVGLAVACLQFELRRLGRPALTNPLLDLVALSDLVLADSPFLRDRKPDLDALASALGLPPTDQRSLASRARLAADVGRRLFGMAGGSGIGSLADLRLALVGTPHPTEGLDAVRPRYLLDRLSLDSFPTDPGVYLLEDAEGAVHYVGKATCLRARLASYLVADLGRSRKMAGIVEKTTRIATRTTSTELEAQLLEARLIVRLRPRFNVQRRLQTELLFLARNLADDCPRAPGQPRRSPWVILSHQHGPDSLGPLLPTEGRRLLGEARRRFRLGAGRGTARWLERADAAWEWIDGEVDRSAVVGNLTSGDLQLFAIAAPWPPPLDEATVEEEPEEEPMAIGRIGWLLSAGEESRDHLGPRLADGVEAFSPEGSGEVEGDRSTRLALFGKSGWLGCLTIEPGTPPEAARQQAREVAETLEEPANESAAIELAVALRFAARQAGALILLRDPSGYSPIVP